jgi:predicted amidohydrolase
MWKIAGVQMDCRRGQRDANLPRIRAFLAEAAGQGARLVIFPECIVSGYCFDSLDEALPHGEALPGPLTEVLGSDCRQLGVYAVVGLLERPPGQDCLFNSAVLVGPSGLVAVYRKIHLPYLGVDRFTTPGDQPFAVHEVDGLRLGMTICYDGSFPESTRALMLLGADLVVLPTNWPVGAEGTIRHLVQCRALENWLYYAAVNRVGTEQGFRFLGQSRLVACNGDLLATASEDREEIIYATIDPLTARNKHLVRIPGKFEVDRLAHRRPAMYDPLTRERSV